MRAVRYGVRERPTANPTNRFASTATIYDDGEAPPPSALQLIDDQSKSILAHNDSPDIGFRWSVNPYRGCSHACAYCYARPSHEYLSLGAGTDFDTKIVVKRRAPELLREAFDKPSWRGEQVMFSGVTDCYQPAEAELQLTRRCLEVCLAYRNPVGLITKSALVLRDVELLAELAREAGLHVAVSVAFADAAPARAIEPWAPAPATRFRVIEALAKAGVPVGVMCAPIMPGLNDDQMVRVLESARAAGATSASWVLLRLPGAVATVFEERVRAAMPLSVERILHRIRETRGGEKLYDARFGVRGRGEGVYAQTLAALFDATAIRLGFAHRGEHRQMESRFRRPEPPPPTTGQLSLF